MSNIVWLARHGSREDSGVIDWWETAKRPHDPGLSKKGMGEAKKLARSLIGEDISCIYSSPYLRAVQTANFIAEELNIPVNIEPGIGEIQCKEYFSEQPELLELKELKKICPMVNTEYKSLTPCPVYPEVTSDLFKRTKETFKLISEQSQENIMFVGHGISIAGLIKAYLNMKDRYGIGICSLTKLVYKDKWIIEKLTDRSHLD